MVLELKLHLPCDEITSNPGRKHREKFLLGCKLKATTSSEDIINIKTSFNSAKLQRNHAHKVCIIGAPAMLGSHSQFQKKVKKVTAQARIANCVNHRCAPASKTLHTTL